MPFLWHASRHLHPARAAVLRRFLSVAVATQSPLKAHLLEQRRHARKLGRAEAVPDVAVAAKAEGTRSPSDPKEFVPPEVPKEILDEWDKEPQVQEFMAMFASQDLKGKKLLSHRDVAKLLESVGLSLDDLTDMLNDEGGDDDDDDDDDEDDRFGAQKGGRKGEDTFGKGGDMFGKGGDMLGKGRDIPGKGDGRGKVGGKGATSRGGLGKGVLGQLDGLDDDDVFGFGGKGKGAGGKGFGKGKGSGKGRFGY